VPNSSWTEQAVGVLKTLGKRGKTPGVAEDKGSLKDGEKGMKIKSEDFKIMRSEQSRARIEDLIPPSTEVRTLFMLFIVMKIKPTMISMFRDTSSFVVHLNFIAYYYLLHTHKVADILQRVRTALLDADIAQSIKSRSSESSSPQGRTSSPFTTDPKTSARGRALCGGTKAVEGPWGDATLDVHRYVPIFS
jgi:hypothetical protein